MVPEYRNSTATKVYGQYCNPYATTAYYKVDSVEYWDDCVVVVKVSDGTVHTEGEQELDPEQVLKHVCLEYSKHMRDTYLSTLERLFVRDFTCWGDQRVVVMQRVPEVRILIRGPPCYKKVEACADS